MHARTVALRRLSAPPGAIIAVYAVALWRTRSRRWIWWVLRRPVVVVGLLGVERRAERIALQLDEPERFVAAVRDLAFSECSAPDDRRR